MPNMVAGYSYLIRWILKINKENEIAW